MIEAIHEERMRAAIAEAERARGSTGDNPWVGCVIVDERGEIVASGHTQGPGEDHAEIVAMRRARAQGVELARTTLYSTLEPCSFHGRTPACAGAIAAAGFGVVVTGIRDPNPRVDGLGLQILRRGGVEVVEDVCVGEITRQLAGWIFRYHPHEPLRRAGAFYVECGGSAVETARFISEYYGVEMGVAEGVVGQLGKT